MTKLSGALNSLNFYLIIKPAGGDSSPPRALGRPAAQDLDKYYYCIYIKRLY